MTDLDYLAEMGLEKTDEYTRHRDAMKAQGFAVVHGFKADAMRDELLAALAAEKQRADEAVERLREREPSEAEYEAHRYEHLYGCENRLRQEAEAKLAAVELERATALHTICAIRIWTSVHLSNKQNESIDMFVAEHHDNIDAANPAPEEEA